MIDVSVLNFKLIKKVVGQERVIHPVLLADTG